MSDSQPPPRVETPLPGNSIKMQASIEPVPQATIPAKKRNDPEPLPLNMEHVDSVLVNHFETLQMA